ncbi:MAG: indole-3-glycerol phosphate synthase TrpC [Clostridiales Family XIII bacterium]|jgi:indole-3-glycerol phosphate synthase|nr:indole-3-glycerol phosphate synthase TrpC [Clostridiales Family XIII bacterium]
MNILDRLAESSAARVKRDKKAMPQEELVSRIPARTKPAFAFEKALKRPGLSFICEVKKASPSKGVISENFPYLEIASDYEAAGADGVSVLTEPEYFLGSDRYLEEISRNVSVPVLRKDFTVDPYQIYQARLLGADAVLLICAILDTDALCEFIKLADSLGLSALTEVHDADELKTALAAGARLIGANSRNLKDFTVDLENCRKLRALTPPDILFVAESGIKGRDDVETVRQSGADAVLIGEALMSRHDKRAALSEFRGTCAI